MICYYRNGISCDANRREFGDQSVIKGKIKIKRDKTKLVSHLGEGEGFYVKRGEEKKKEKKRSKAKKGMDLYGLLWFCMDYYGFLWICELLYGYLFVPI